MSINPIATSLNPSKFEEFAKLCPGFEGALAIVKEWDRVNYVRVSNVVADSEGVTALITCVPAPGMLKIGHDNRDSTVLFAAWEVFSFDINVWHAQYVAWRVFFDLAFVEKVVALAADAAKEGKIIEARAVLKTHIDHERSQRSSTPNPLTPPL